MPLVYSFVARGNDILADHAAFSGNVKQIAGDLLPKVEAEKCTFTAQQHTFNFLKVQPFTFLVVADEAFGRQLPFAFLDRVNQEFITKHGTKATTAPPGSFQKIFGPQLKQHMEYVQSHPEEISKVAAVQKQVDEVRNIMVDNIDKVLQRGERLEVLVDRTEALSMNAEAFRNQGRTLRRTMWWNNLKVKILIAFLVLVLAVVIFLLACFAGGNNCTKRSG